jgi:hypothetical protein
MGDNEDTSLLAMGKCWVEIQLYFGFDFVFFNTEKRGNGVSEKRERGDQAGAQLKAGALGLADHGE